MQCLSRARRSDHDQAAGSGHGTADAVGMFRLQRRRYASWAPWRLGWHGLGIQARRGLQVFLFDMCLYSPSKEKSSKRKM